MDHSGLRTAEPGPLRSPDWSLKAVPRRGGIQQCEMSLISAIVCPWHPLAHAISLGSLLSQQPQALLPNVQSCKHNHSNTGSFLTSLCSAMSRLPRYRADSRYSQLRLDHPVNGRFSTGRCTTLLCRTYRTQADSPVSLEVVARR